MPDDNTKVVDTDLDAALLGELDDGDNGDDSDDGGNDNADGAAGNDGNDGNADDSSDGDSDGEIDWKNELNKARSDWGRKQKTLETQVGTLTDNVNRLIEGIAAGNTQQQTNTQQNADDDLLDSDEPIPLTMGGLAQAMNKILTNKQDQSSHQDKVYENKYMKTVGNLGSDYSDKVHKHIVDRMFKEFNNKHSDNPSIDAELNFAKAEAAVLRDVRTRKTNPLKGNSPNNPLGGSTNTDQDVNAQTVVKLDEHAKAFIASTGMKEEDAQKALQGEMPLYLRGKVSV